MFIEIFLATVGFGTIISIILTLYTMNMKSKEQRIIIPAPQVNVNMRPLEDAIKEIPNKVLQSIQSSTNTHKGVLGELIGYLKLHAEYDRIIPLNNIIDFLAIKLPTETEPGMISFIDIKTGKYARLSKDQKLLKKIIEDKNIEFIKYNISDPGALDSIDNK